MAILIIEDTELHRQPYDETPCAGLQLVVAGDLIRCRVSATALTFNHSEGFL
jgi:hypothetical protein